jgi:hypothetical protein
MDGSSNLPGAILLNLNCRITDFRDILLLDEEMRRVIVRQGRGITSPKIGESQRALVTKL